MSIRFRNSAVRRAVTLTGLPIICGRQSALGRATITLFCIGGFWRLV